MDRETWWAAVHGVAKSQTNDSVTWDDLYFIDENAEAQRGRGAAKAAARD